MVTFLSPTDRLLHLPTDVRHLLQLLGHLPLREHLPVPVQHDLHVGAGRRLRTVRANLPAKDPAGKSGAVSTEPRQPRDDVVPDAPLAPSRSLACW